MPLTAAQEAVVAKAFGPLRATEQVVDVCSGTIAAPGQGVEHSGYIFVTTERVVLRMKSIGRWHTLDFQPSMIASIEQSSGWGGGKITILAAGSATRVRQIPKDDVDRIADRIRGLVGGSSTPHRGSGESADVGGLESELRKLSGLRETGLISQDEFSSLRLRLLDSFG